MKKIKSIYILFIFAAFSSYGLWACTNSSTSETTSETDETSVGITQEVEVPDDCPASAIIDNDFYIKATIRGKDYDLNYIPKVVDDRYNLLTSNLFRIERCADEQCKQNLYIQAHNFDLDQQAPFTIVEDQNAKPRKEIIFNFILTDNKGEYKTRWKDSAISPFEMTINKIEGEIYEGTFKGSIEEAKNNSQDSTLNITGSFRTKMVIQKPAA